MENNKAASGIFSLLPLKQSEQIETKLECLKLGFQLERLCLLLRVFPEVTFIYVGQGLPYYL